MNAPNGNGTRPLHFPEPAMARAIAREVAQMLADSGQGGEGGIIDLRSLPMSPEEMQELEDILGQGEVQATIAVSGHSEVRETGHAGVWWVRHFDSTGAIQSQQIVVARIPEILCADAQDMARAGVALADALSAPASPEEGDDHGRA
jgi:hydrogenase-1 operon protein HyaF